MTQKTPAAALSAPARAGSLALPNHLVMAPLTRNRAEPDGTPTGLMAEYYVQRASAGLIVAEAATPNAVGQTYPDIAAIHTPRHVAVWRRVTDAVRAGAERMLEAGADLVALGRPFLANPDLVERLRRGAPLNAVRERYFMYTGGAAGYTDHPALDGAGQPSSEPIVALDGPRVSDR
ncbi:hypothetical protein [Streptomyces sp. NPDC093094]|uniref:oxidoreductase n=1 Tax=Streptomyces sp. NPDC093094 TaxID=3366026 RepID=UPI003830EE69